MPSRVASAVVVVLAAALSLRLDAHERITTKITWDVEIAPIVQARCVSCHTAGGAAPMPLDTYEQARPWARAIRDEVLARRMPKWHAARGYGDFANDRSLSPFEIGLIASWAGGGAPKRLPRIPANRDSAGAPAAQVRAAAPRPLPPLDGRTRTLPCGDAPLSGRLLAVRPALEPGSNAAISITMPDGRREIVAWIRGYDPSFPDVYRLRTPIDLPPGSLLTTRADGRCSIDATVE